MEAAVGAGHLEIVALLQEHGDDADFIEENAFHADTGGHLDVILFVPRAMQSSGASQCFTANVISFAVRYDRLNVLKFLFPRLRQRIAMWTICLAAYRNHMHLMEWLHAKLSEMSGLPWLPEPDALYVGYTTIGADRTYQLPMSFAAKNGNLEMVQWLDANGYGECTPSVMNWAAENGHLDAVKWFHENRSEGCTIDATDNAAGNGKLEVVKWLHTHRTEGCTASAVNMAARNGHVCVVRSCC